MEQYQKSGYLKEKFRYFHLHTKIIQDFPYHYHDFHKVLVFLKGDVTYHIEGRTFMLEPGDIVLIPTGDIHKPELNSPAVYERIIFYLSPDFPMFKDERAKELNLCFQNAKYRQMNVLRLSSSCRKQLLQLCLRMEEETKQPEHFAHTLYQEALLAEFLILLNRGGLSQQSTYPENVCKDKKMLLVLDYINKHLSEPLSIDLLSSRFFLSRYYLMHSFKAATGYTVGNYITTKRLLYARSLIQEGASVTDACYASGFQNYSTFARAYKKQFHVNARSG